MLGYHAKINQGRFNTATGIFRRDIISRSVLNNSFNQVNF